MTESQSFKLEKGESPMECIRRTADEMGIDAEIPEDMTVKELLDIFKQRLLN